ncbi:farnesyl pyrophosphate synthase 1-like isoform X1 [Juglans microcarpa x Juglans regia]|uniref:farnesyl pyrophosphate synthase 1-like isoform X1 n=1 Tax=Juglans microcarpa x Juglans regia TaxID=2249226 RepID=UPI001B7EE90C|nr:farnesyl pyrophosphate synthase 1-like isoform X1 [Juglans microcarpa x Juglans regia]
MGDLRSRFLDVYSVLKSEILHDPAFDFTEDSRQWVERMLDHNVPRENENSWIGLLAGKLNRGLCVIDSYKLLKEEKELTDDEFFLACALGWCIEWLQAYFRVLDDITDNIPEDAVKRRGQPSWFKQPMVGMIAVNDGSILHNHITRILKKHFREKPYYVDLLDLFNEMEFQTASGKMTDLIASSTLIGEKDLSKSSTLRLHHLRIVQYYKTTYYSHYLSVACALLMSGENHINVKNILVEMGFYFQVQGVAAEYENENYGKLVKSIEAHPSKAVQAVLKSLLTKGHQ